MAYARPTTLEEAVALAGSAPWRLLAGGTDLYPATDAPALSGDVLDLTGIAGLRGIARDGAGWRIGALTSWAGIASAPLPPAFAALQAAAREVGGPQVQTAGTLGGNLCNASPAADGVPPLLVLDASVELASPRGTRVLPLSRFLLGPRRTARAADEILTAVLVPDQPGASGFAKLGARRYLVISIAMVAVRLAVAGGRVAGVALSVGACGPVAVRLPGVEAALLGAPADDGLAGRIDDAAVAGALSPLTDIRATADYRAAAATELLRRTLQVLAQQPERQAA